LSDKDVWDGAHRQLGNISLFLAHDFEKKRKTENTLDELKRALNYYEESGSKPEVINFLLK